jgi:RNA polymerase sigma-70 factor (ECF subfamily)
MADTTHEAAAPTSLVGGRTLSRNDAEPSSRASRDENVERLFRLSSPRLGKFLIQVVSDRALAEDLLQEVFVSALRDRKKLTEAKNAEAWLFGIARNHALAALRRRRRGRRALERLGRERAKQAPDPAEAAAIRTHLEAVTSPEERILLVLRYLHGFDSAELGLIVGRSPEAVRQQLSRSRRRLIAALNDEAADEPPTENAAGGGA